MFFQSQLLDKNALLLFLSHPPKLWSVVSECLPQIFFWLFHPLGRAQPYKTFCTLRLDKLVCLIPKNVFLDATTFAGKCGAPLLWVGSGPTRKCKTRGKCQQAPGALAFHNKGWYSEGTPPALLANIKVGLKC